MLPAVPTVGSLKGGGLINQSGWRWKVLRVVVVFTVFSVVANVLARLLEPAMPILVPLIFVVGIGRLVNQRRRW